MITRYTKHKTIPSVSTRKSSPTTTNFARGIYTYRPNDKMDLDQIRLAQDARFDRVGEYITRKGFKKMMEPIGKTVLSSNINESPTMVPLTEADNYEFTASETTLIYSAKVKLRTTDANLYAVPMISILVDGEKVASSCVNPENITGAATEFEFIFMKVPTIFSGETVSITVGTQDGRDSAFEVAAVDGTLMVEVDTCTEGAIDSVFEANIDGVKTILFVQNAILYRMNEDGVVHQIRQLPNGVKKVRFSQNLNQIRYADGKEGPRLIDPADNWSDTAITTADLETDTDLEIKVSNILNGAQADNMIYFNSDVDTEAVWTWPYGYEYAPPIIYTTDTPIGEEIGDTVTIDRDMFQALTSRGVTSMEVGDRLYGPGAKIGEVKSINFDPPYTYHTVTVETVDGTAIAINSYDKFSRNFYQNFPAILTGDPITAMFNLGGVYYFLTRRNKYQMYAQTADTWNQGACSAQNGTFSQESVVCDTNYAYFANDSGIYQFNGTSEWSLTQDSIQNIYDAIPDKENITIDLYNNRLYVFYTGTKDGINDHCLVYNTKLQVWESFDSNTYISATSGRQNSSNCLICGHSRIGLLVLAEEGDFSDLGQQIAFNLETAYYHFGTTSQLKRMPKWRPEFGSAANDYTVQCGYALDFTDEVKYAFSIDLQRQKIVAENYIWDSPEDYHTGDAETVHTTLPQVYGEFYRCQIRYQHIAAFEPVNFKSHTLTLQTQRIR